ncbi:MAG TPA: YiiX/YebB-like N1pC/P60 family cysteine hydrolase [Burkholderiales bacterium]|nr:YiiX/YebB-like N1pC/P60 family cysteine hydrolase [Burkholderiales bacterium]
MPMLTLAALALAVCSAISSLLARCRSGWRDTPARDLAQPVNYSRTSPTADAQSLSAVLRPGDVLLTDRNTLMAALVRLLTGSTWSHVSIYVGPLEGGPDPRCIVEARVATGVRAASISEFKGQRVRILRPTGLRDADRHRLVDWIVGRIGDKYDVAHAWALAGRLLRLPLVTRLLPAPGSIARGATRFVCSTLLAQAFVLVGYPIAATRIAIADAQASEHRYVIPRDFEIASGFEVVRAKQVD